MNETIKFRQATVEDFDSCFEIHYQAFKDYPIFTVYKGKNEQEHENFNRSIMTVQLQDSFRDDIVLVGERIIKKENEKENDNDNNDNNNENGKEGNENEKEKENDNEEREMVCVALLQSPEHREPNILQYWWSSGLAMIRHLWYGGFKTTFGFLDMVNQCNSPLMKYVETHPTWMLESISVKREYFNQGIGSQMINECIIPYIREKGGNCLTLVTNSEKHTKFYEKNQFELIQKDEFTCNNQIIQNWAFKREI